MLDHYSSFNVNTGLETCGSQDSADLKQLLSDFANDKKELNIGEGGAVLRFFVPLLLKTKAKYSLTLGESLAKRRHDELYDFCRSTGAALEREGNKIILDSKASWPHKIKIPVSHSSQYASGILLNSWRLKEDLELQLEGELVSAPYLSMTMKLMQFFGLSIIKKKNSYIIPAGQSPDDKEFHVEPDMSSAFALAAIAAVSGELKILDFPQSSLQADYCFVSVLEDMGISLQIERNNLKVEKANKISGLKFDLKNAPDLFPVLAVLCVNSTEESLLYGAKHLVNKESNRIEAVSQLLYKLGRKHQKREDGILIEAQNPAFFKSSFGFSSHKDHRIAFAAGLAIAMGCKIDLQEPRVVEKSFSSFWSILRKGGLNDVPSSWT